MYQIKTDNSISLAQGDTMLFAIQLAVEGEEAPAQFPEGTVALFAVSQKQSRLASLQYQNVRIASGLQTVSQAAASSYTPVLRKVFPLEYDGAIIVYLTNADTRAIAAGDYVWDVRIVTDPEYDESGNVICDDTTDEVISLFSGGNGMPKFTVTEVAAIV